MSSPLTRDLLPPIQLIRTDGATVVHFTNLVMFSHDDFGLPCPTQGGRDIPYNSAAIADITYAISIKSCNLHCRHYHVHVFLVSASIPVPMIPVILDGKSNQILNIGSGALI